MNGAKAELPPKTITIPNNKSRIIIGANQYFFRSLINSKISLIKSISLVVYNISFNQFSRNKITYFFISQDIWMPIISKIVCLLVT